MQIIQKRKYTFGFSTVLVVSSLIILMTWGLRLGIDFKGGTMMEVQFSKELNREKVENKLLDLNLNSLTVQNSQEGRMILHYIASDENSNEKVLERLQNLDDKVEQLRVDFVGASVSKQLKKNAVEAIIWAIIGIALYIAWAFRKVSKPISSWQYGIGAIIALAHDIIITVGIFVILGRFAGVEVGVPFVAALLTILGYSVNDTIVVYDRIRENLLRFGFGGNFEEVVNKSINETIARSLNTSLTVIVVLLAIILFGGESIKYFAMALLIGVGIGTYSSIFVASALLVESSNRK